jgi:hypothetical protein
MSRIYLHSIEGSVAVQGTERHYMGYLISGLALAFLDRVYRDELRLVCKDSYVSEARSDAEFDRYFAVWLRTGTGKFVGADGKYIDPFAVQLNTAYRAGSDPIKLMTRIHGQCELHCYIREPNKVFVRAIILEGLHKGLFRDNVGWVQAADFLGSTPGNVVFSTSVGSSFPNAELAGMGEEFDKLHPTEQWNAAWANLQKESGLEITPERWDSFYFGSGHWAGDVIEEGRKLSVK